MSFKRTPSIVTPFVKIRSFIVFTKSVLSKIATSSIITPLFVVYSEIVFTFTDCGKDTMPLVSEIILSVAFVSSRIVKPFEPFTKTSHLEREPPTPSPLSMIIVGNAVFVVKSMCVPEGAAEFRADIVPPEYKDPSNPIPPSIRRAPVETFVESVVLVIEISESFRRTFSTRTPAPTVFSSIVSTTIFGAETDAVIFTVLNVGFPAVVTSWSI